MERLEDLDLNLLLLLYWLLEEQNVTRAASRLGISQPAASRGLQRLRVHFKNELLIRSGRTLIPSKLATSLHPDLKTAMQHLRLVAKTESEFDPQTFERRITIACNDYLAAICAPVWQKRIAPAIPRAILSWRPLESETPEALASGEIDFVLAPNAAQVNMPNTAIMQDMVIKPLLNDVFVVFGTRNHPLLAPSELTQGTFAAADHILVSPQGHGHGAIDEALAELNLTRSIKQRSWSFQHAADLAVHSDMLVVLPERLARLRQDGMYRPMPLDIDGLNSSIIWHASRTGDKAHLWLRQELIRSFRE